MRPLNQSMGNRVPHQCLGRDEMWGGEAGIHFDRPLAQVLPEYSLVHYNIPTKILVDGDPNISNNSYGEEKNKSKKANRNLSLILDCI